MTYQEKKDILRGLPKGSPVKYTGEPITNGEGVIILRRGAQGYKTRNGRGQYKNLMHLFIGGPRRWAIEYTDLTCKAIEAAERLINTAKQL